MNDDGMPRVGTALRELYDRLKEHRGAHIEIDRADAAQVGAKMIFLRDFWGCDIRWVGRRQYALVGEIMLDGSYRDYVAEVNS